MRREEQLFVNPISGLSMFTVAAVALTILATTARAEVACDPDPLAVTCLTAGKTKLSVHDDPAVGNDNKDKLSWNWSRGDAIPPGGWGDPGVDTEYAVCLYDGDNGVHKLVRDLQIPASATLWEVEPSKGSFQFTDLSTSYDGVFQLRLKGDATPGQSLVKLKARGINLQPPGPPIDLPLQYFEQNPSVIVHLINSDGLCLEAEYVAASNRKMTGKDYRGATD